MKNTKLQFRLNPDFVAKTVLKIGTVLNEQTMSLQDPSHSVVYSDLPFLSDIISGTDVLRHCIQVSRDKDKTKYYVCRLSQPQSLSLIIFLTDTGLILSASQGPIKDLRLHLVGFILSQPGIKGARVMGIADLYNFYIKKHLPGTKINMHLYNTGDLADELHPKAHANAYAGVFSVACLGRFFVKNPTRTDDQSVVTAALDKINSGTLILRGAVDESIEFVSLTREQYKRFEEEASKGQLILGGKMGPTEVPKWLTKLSPGRGYVPTGTVRYPDINGQKHIKIRWHRSGNVLFECTESSTQYIFGVDESTYFGCELPQGELYDTPEDALLALAPKEARVNVRTKVSQLKPRTQRQGEWFAVLKKGRDVVRNPIHYPDESMWVSSFPLPRQSYDENIHHVESHQFDNIKDKSGNFPLAWINKNTGEYFVYRGRVRHLGGDHDTMFLHACASDSSESVKSLDSAFALYRNRAVRSFSEDGVD